MPPKTKSFKNRLNFWSSAINHLINTPVAERYYNLAGSKTKAIENFVSAVLVEAEFDEVQVSTLICAFKTIQYIIFP